MIQPTWFMSRELFDSLGGYDESPVSVPLPHSVASVSVKKRRLDAGGGGDGELVVAPSTNGWDPFPEDLTFFHRHLERGGTLHRVDKELLVYRCVSKT
jgi:hypothetical protein